MIKKSYQVKHPIGAFFFTFLALLWCAYVVFPSSQREPCSTSGCQIFQDFHLFGISLWWVGGAYFFLLTLLCLRGSYFIAWQLARLALVIDSLLFLIMLFLAPCTDCLIIGIFFALSYFCLRPEQTLWNQANSSSKLLLFFFWLGLFSANTIIALSEKTPLWSINGKEDRSVEIFFSPECPYCMEAISYFGESAKLYPVMQKPSDLEQIANILYLQQQGLSTLEAIKVSKQEKSTISLTKQERITLFFWLSKNKVALFKRGRSSVPLITIHGLPTQWAKGETEKQVSPAQQDLSSPSSIGIPLEGESSFLEPHSSFGKDLTRPWDDKVLSCDETNALCP